jgi:hypothetical protein
MQATAATASRVRWIGSPWLSHDSGVVVVDAVDDPVRAASRTEPIGQRGQQQWICCLTRLS